ncbi:MULTISPECIES: hypothetical protein [Mycolicibacterium]|nr:MULTISPECIES: hypothetical protein [Mycolicibacterium]MCV7183804.1 hypothetical protein [Mycolicibacterium murale]BBY84643.1 hypothetical protein MTOK_04250 [Mycolicibacterium tokaiense]GFG57730.1 hypothetical protein MMUR_18660 [Mycolicibacterium murale]
MQNNWLDSMNGLTDVAKHGEPDLKLTTEVRDAYIKAVHDLRDLLNEQLKKINALPGYGEPGDLQSALQTKTNLQHGINDLKRVIGEYTKYLDAFADTVTEAGKRLIHSG